MAGLDLTPNPAVLVTQAGIFLTALYVVKSTMVTPYLKVRHRRLTNTQGNQSQAKETLEAVAKKQEELDSRIREAYSSAKEASQQFVAKARKKKDELLQDAHSKARVKVQFLEKSIEEAIHEETAKVPAIVAAVTQICMDQVVHR